MRYIEPHAHMVSRVTDDYSAMVTAVCRAVCGDPTLSERYGYRALPSIHII